MGRLLSGSINLMKIDKSKIVDKDKFGEPFKNGGKFINVSIWVEDLNQVDQYGNIGSISTGTSAEDRVYIGNLKEFPKKDDNPAIPAAEGEEKLPWDN